MNKKQLVSLLLSAVLVLSLAACGGGTTPPAPGLHLHPRFQQRARPRACP